MTISEQLGALRVCRGVGAAELARRMGTAPRNFKAGLKRESFAIYDLQYPSKTVGRSLARRFVLSGGDKA